MDKLFSVKDVAVKLEVTRQTVYNHIDKNIEQLKGEIKKIQGTTYLTGEGVRILKQSMGLLQVPVKNETVELDAIMKELKDSINYNVKESMENVREDIKKDNEKLENELAEVKKQNEILIKKIDDLIEKKEEKKSFFDIFKRK